MNDRHGRWVLVANLAGYAAVGAALVFVLWLGWAAKADEHVPRRGPLSTPTAAAPR